MYINAKMDTCKGEWYQNKAKNVYVEFEEWKMEKKYNSIHRWRNMFLAVALPQTRQDLHLLRQPSNINKTLKGASTVSSDSYGALLMHIRTVHPEKQRG